MTEYVFKDASTQPVSQTLLIGLAGPTGSGKTESALRLGRGLVGPRGKFCVLDTENRRALNKKNRHRFDHLDLQPPYTPENYEGAIRAALKAGYGAIIIDSFSHEWDGDGGLSDEAADILERLSKGNAAVAERMTALSWKVPKTKHKKLMGFLRKCDVPIIFCLRAEPKIKFIKEKDEKTGREVTKVIDAGWLPIAEKMFGFDMLIYALLMAENPGIPVHLKKLEPEFEPMFALGTQITEEVGAGLSAWVKGNTPSPNGGTSHHTLQQLVAMVKAAGLGEQDLRGLQRERYGVERFNQLKPEQIDILYAHFEALKTAPAQPEREVDDQAPPGATIAPEEMPEEAPQSEVSATGSADGKDSVLEEKPTIHYATSEEVAKVKAYAEQYGQLDYYTTMVGGYDEIARKRLVEIQTKLEWRVNNPAAAK